VSPCDFKYATPQESVQGIQIQAGQRHEGHCGGGFSTGALAGLAQGILCFCDNVMPASWPMGTNFNIIFYSIHGKPCRVPF